MRENRWSWSVGQLFGIDIRIHLILIIFAIGGFLVDLRLGVAGWGLAHTLLLFLAVLLHELGHCFAARRLGGYADRIVLWPLGGLADCQVEEQPVKHILLAAAGPAVNLALVIASGMVLLLSGTAVWIGGLEGFLGLEAVMGRSTLLWLTQWFFATNAMLLVFNLLVPAWPMDGGRILQGLLWLRYGQRRSLEIATTVTLVVAPVLVLLAIVGGLLDGLLLLLIALFVFANALAQRRQLREMRYEEEPEFDYGVPRGLDLSVRTAPRRRSIVARWRAARAARRVEKARRRRREIESEVDRILAKVSAVGLPGLTGAERRFLKSASKHFRQR